MLYVFSFEVNYLTDFYIRYEDRICSINPIAVPLNRKSSIIKFRRKKYIYSEREKKKGSKSFSPYIFGLLIPFV